MKSLLSGILLIILVYNGFAGDKGLFLSQSFDWGKTKVVMTKYGSTRQFMKGFTNHLDYVEIHATTLNPGKEAPIKDIQLKLDKLLILKEGKIVQIIDGEKKVLTPGSVILGGADELLRIENQGSIPAVYFMIQWKNHMNSPVALAPGMKSETIKWEDVTVIPTGKGSTRRFYKKPMDFLYEFEMHVTMLNQGINSHPPHTHIDDEIILIKSGNVEEVINDETKQLGPGSFVLLNGNDTHGIRNIGDGPCEYFAFRFLREEPKK
jgi:(S)-ureidoglycine aminohydrolase